MSCPPGVFAAGGWKPLGLLRSVSREELKLFEPFPIPTRLFLWFQNVASRDMESSGGQCQERRRGLQGRVKFECVIFIYVSFKPLPSLKFFPSSASSYCCWCRRGRAFFPQRCHAVYTRLGDLSQSQIALLPQSQSIACQLAQPILGRKCKQKVREA